MYLIVLGIFAGLASTVTGMGGGVILLVALALVWGPAEALAVTSVAVLIGCAHRFSMFRGHVSWRVVVPLMLGAVPAAVVAGALAMSVPRTVLHACIVALVVVATGGPALARQFEAAAWLGRLRSASGRALVAPGAGVGVAAASGGAGLVLGPLLLSIGMFGDAYVATLSLSGVALNTGRVAGYALGGAVDASVLLLGGKLALAVVAGNLLGGQVRQRLAPAALRRLELAQVVLCTVVAIAGLGRAA